MKTKVRFSIVLLMLLGGLWAATQKIVAHSPFHKLMNHPIMGEILTKWDVISRQTEGERIYLHIDKPIVEPGDDIWFTAYIRNSTTLKPSNFSDIIHLELINPKGAKEKELNLIAQKGMVNGDFLIDSEMPGGIYKIKAWTNYQTNDSSYFEKEIQVQDLITPDVLVKFKFDKSAYGAGEKSSIEFELKNQQQKILATNVTLELFVENKLISSSTILSSASEATKTSITLPATLNSNDVLVKLNWEVDGLKDSYSRPVPVTLNKLTLDFFPEGGDLVNGISNRVAFRAVDLNGKAAEIKGTILVNKKEVGTLESYHQGRGTFSIIPAENDEIVIQLSKPFKQEIPVTLSRADAGFSMTCSTFEKNKLSLAVSSTLDDSVYVVLQCRSSLQYSKTHFVKKGKNIIDINTFSFPVGIHQITLFDAKGIERCERLIFVNKDRKLSIDISTDKKHYQPREKVKASISIKDERGLPVPAAISVAVIKESLFQEVKNNPSTILSSLLIEQELKSKIEEPGFYFNPKESKADTALDMLLLTEGWRRFSWQEVRDDQVQPFAIAPEKAIIKGRIINGSTYQPFAGISILHNGKVVGKTDSIGNYQLRNILLYEAAQLTFGGANMSNQTMQIVAYGTQTDLYVYDDQYYKRMEAVPMMNRGGIDDLNEMERGDFDAPKGNNNMVPKAAMKKNEIRVENKKALKPEVANLPAKPVDQKPAPIVKAKAMGEKILAADMEINEDEFDMRWDKNIRRPNPIPANPVVTYYRGRVFEVKTPPSFTEVPRSDFRNTVYWSGAILIDKTGKSNFEFYNTDEIASFRITTEGISNDGLIGHSEKVITTVLPLSLRVNIPGECTEGDQLLIPVTIKNNTAEARNTNLILVLPEHLKTASTTIPVSISASENKTIYISIQAIKSGTANLNLSMNVGSFSDEVNVPVKVISRGFPYEVSVSGKEKVKEFRFDMKNVVKGSAYTTFSAYPDVVSDLMKGVESIIREPYGCFEQTSTSNYPNVMAKLYLKESGTKSDKEEYLDEVLDKGYKRLTSYETKTKGYEWFGSTPAHEALTAYGLMQFKDMQKAYGEVDDKMIARTAEWLFSRRDGNGGFQRSAQALDEFGRADDAISNAYIVYALSEAGFKDIQKELATSEAVAKKDQDPYILAMISQAFYNLGDTKKGDALLEILMKKQNADGSWIGNRHSITRSEGISLRVETTSLAVMAMLKSQNKDMKALEAGIKSLLNSRSGYGGFGSTQGTILALKALTRYASFMKQTNESGTIEIRINKQLAGTKKYEAGERNAITLDGMEKFLKDGENLVEIKFVGVNNPLPFSMAIGWNTTEPSSDKDCKVDLSTTLAQKKVANSTNVRLTCTLKNKTTEGLPMTMAEIGLPAGTQAQAWQLKELQDKKEVDFYEIKGNRVILYYRQMKPSETRIVNLDLKAAVPGKYEGQASSAYLYYTPEFKKWVAPVIVEISK